MTQYFERPQDLRCHTAVTARVNLLSFNVPVAGSGEFCGVLPLTNAGTLHSTSTSRAFCFSLDERGTLLSLGRWTGLPSTSSGDLAAAVNDRIYRSASGKTISME